MDLSHAVIQQELFTNGSQALLQTLKRSRVSFLCILLDHPVCVCVEERTIQRDRIPRDFDKAKTVFAEHWSNQLFELEVQGVGFALGTAPEHPSMTVMRNGARKSVELTCMAAELLIIQRNFHEAESHHTIQK